MAENSYEMFRGLALSAVEVKQLTGWPDAMVEDYLSLLESLINLANIIDVGNNFARNVQKQLIDPIFGTNESPQSYVVASSDHTTIGCTTVICANNSLITITLNATPSNFELVNIKRANERVLIDGNGRTIDQHTEITINRQYTNLQLVYALETDSWYII